MAATKAQLASKVECKRDIAISISECLDLEQ